MAPRRLLLLRHGKSDWHADYGSDHDRPLAPRGERAADLVGRWLRRAGRIPDLALTSSARRARDTVYRAATSGEWPCEIRELDELYMTSAAGALAVAAGTPAEIDTLLLAGHQPTLSSLAALAIGGGEVRMPTAGLACLRLESGGIGHGDWAAARPGAFVLEWHVIPRLLEAVESSAENEPKD